MSAILDGTVQVALSQRDPATPFRVDNVKLATSVPEAVLCSCLVHLVITAWMLVSVALDTMYTWLLLLGCWLVYCISHPLHLVTTAWMLVCCISYSVHLVTTAWMLVSVALACTPGYYCLDVGKFVALATLFTWLLLIGCW